MNKPRPSSLPNLSACPRWVTRPKTMSRTSMDEAADEGTFFHEKMEELALKPVDSWDEVIANDPDLGPATRPMIQEAAQQVRHLFGLGLPVVSKKTLGLPADAHYELTDLLNADGIVPDGIYLEVGIDPGVTSPGTGDVVLVQGNRGVYADYKSNRVERSHDLQMKAYVLGLFRAAPRVGYIENLIVAPRLYLAHEPVSYKREDTAALEAELSEVVERAADLFEPGHPGEQCAMCAGNGRCPWQMASLRDIPAETGLVFADVWRDVLAASSPEHRGLRRKLVKWLESYVESAKEDDKEWARACPDALLPGFTKSVQLGRPSVDKDRLPEINEAIRSEYGLNHAEMMAFLVPDKERAAAHIAFAKGLAEAEVKAGIGRVTAPFVTRGPDIIMFRAVKEKRDARAVLGASGPV